MFLVKSTGKLGELSIALGSASSALSKRAELLEGGARDVTVCDLRGDVYSYEMLIKLAALDENQAAIAS